MASPNAASRLGSPAWRKGVAADLRLYWPMWLIAAVAVGLRLYEVHRLPGMQGDEAWYGLQARLWLAGDPIEWRTPTGNVPGMIHLWSLIMLHAMFEPSLLLLRVPSITSSVAAMLLVHAIGRRFFGQAAGMSALVLMACLPVNIAYARLGWDPSHSPLLLLAAAYAAFAGRKRLCALLFALAVTNHPSAAFAAPFLTLAFLGFAIDRGGLKLAIERTGQQAALLLLAILAGMALSPNASAYLSFSKSVSRLLDPSAWLDFGLLFSRLLSGESIYVYMFGTGFGATAIWADLVAIAALLAIIAAGAFFFVRRRDWPVAGVVFGWLASLLLLFLIAGLWTMSPKLLRFALPMIPLTVLAAAAICGRLLAERRWLLQLLLIAVALPMLAGFWFHYTQPLQGGAARPVPGFWTGRQDPALMAYKRITGDPAAAGRAQIIAEDWWLQMPISYYAVGQPHRPIDAGSQPLPRNGQELTTYWVTYADGKLDRALAGRIVGGPTWIIATAHAGNSLHVWREMGSRPPGPTKQRD